MRKQKMRRVFAAAVCGAALLSCLGACKMKEVSLDDDAAAGQSSASAPTASGDAINFTMPAVGDDVAILTIKDYGDVKIRLFPEETEKGVDNFKQLTESGFYDELIFHRVIDGFMIQGGDPKGDGTGGRDAWNSGGFEQVISPRLYSFTGAVAYAVGADKLNTSQFFIVTGGAVSASDLSDISAMAGKTFPPGAKDFYEAFGGYPYLDSGYNNTNYEIFGQVYDGMEHVLEIQKVKTNDKDKPKTPVVIEKAVIAKYDGETPNWINWNGESVPVSAES